MVIFVFVVQSLCVFLLEGFAVFFYSIYETRGQSKKISQDLDLTARRLQLLTDKKESFNFKTKKFLRRKVFFFLWVKKTKGPLIVSCCRLISFFLFVCCSCLMKTFFLSFLIFSSKPVVLLIVMLHLPESVLPSWQEKATQQMPDLFHLLQL